MTKLWKLDAEAMAGALEAGSVTAEELTEAALARIAEVDTELNSFCFVDADGARALAQASDRRRQAGNTIGPLDGVPFSVKDNLFVSGMPATWGSRKWKSFVPEMDDISVERMKNAGAVLLGKTNTPEFASIATTVNDLFGVTRSPFDTALSPGGSSGGSTASVAAGITPVALGTDAGGSIRQPAAISGLYGLRPTNGAVARAFGFPPLAFDFQAIGLLTRTLADLRTLLAITSGPDYRDPASLFVPPYQGHSGALKVRWFSQVEGSPVDRMVADRVQQAAALIEKHGHAVEEAAPVFSLEQVASIWPVLSPIGATIASDTGPDQDESLTVDVAASVQRAAKITGEMYGRTMNHVLDVRRQVSQAWGDADVYVLPVTPTAAWSAEARGPENIDGQPAASDAAGSYTGWVNVMGYPGLSVPVFPYPDGRPIGVQLVARPGQEANLFALAEVLLDMYAVGSVPLDPRKVGFSHEPSST